MMSISPFSLSFHQLQQIIIKAMALITPSFYKAPSAVLNRTSSRLLLPYISYSLIMLCMFAASPVMANTDKDNRKNLIDVRVQLKWFHQFQFAGFYAAIDQGYFKQAGLNVQLMQGGPTIDPANVVSEGNAEFGIGNSSLLIDFHNGKSVVAVSAIFQRSPFVILARRDEKIHTVNDLEGHTLMGETHASELITYLKLAEVQLEKINMVAHTGTVASLSVNDASGIDATTAYVSTEPYSASQLQVPYQIFNPRDLNIDFYGDLLFTSKKIAANQPNVVISMRDALIKGWYYALKNQDEMLSLIIKHYHPKKDRLALHFEAQVIEGLLASNIVDIGYMSFSRWRHIADMFGEAELLPEDYSLDGFLFELEDEFPYWFYPVILITLVLIVLILIIIFYIVNLNQKLKSLSITDGLTGVSNRRQFDYMLDSEFKRAKRTSQPLSLLMVDVDNFKGFNDHYGHLAGDKCLKRLAKVLRSCAKRNGELVARYGGEEFMVILPATEQILAMEMGEKIRKSVAELNMPHTTSKYGVVTVSVGLFTCVPTDEMNVASFIKNSDTALYCAKDSGRNRTEVYNET